MMRCRGLHKHSNTPGRGSSLSAIWGNWLLDLLRWRLYKFRILTIMPREFGYFLGETWSTVKRNKQRKSLTVMEDFETVGTFLVLTNLAD